VAKQSPISAIAEHLYHISHYPETGKTKNGSMKRRKI